MDLDFDFDFNLFEFPETMNTETVPVGIVFEKYGDEQNTVQDINVIVDT